MLAASCSTGTIKVRQSIWGNTHHGDPTRHDLYNRVNGTRSPWIHRREKRQAIRQNSRRIDCQPAFPIVSPSPPRLRPSEVCQRGPPSLDRHCCATARIEKPSGMRTFAAGSNRIRGLEVKQTLGFARVLLDHIHFTSEMLAHEYDAIRHFPGD